MPRSRLTAVLLILLLSACASKTQHKVTSAATTPLTDLNLVRDEIPEVLQNALKSPYLKPADEGCLALTAEISQLDAALGPDLDAPESDDKPSLLDRGSDMAENTAVGALQRTAEGLVPFRSWVRKLTGAERHSKKMAAAVTAGAIRRAYLKGAGVARACVLTPPAQLASAASAASSATATATATSVSVPTATLTAESPAAVATAASSADKGKR